MQLSARLAAFALALATGSAMWHALAAQTQHATGGAALAANSNRLSASDTARMIARARESRAQDPHANDAEATSETAAADAAAESAEAPAADEPPALRWSDEVQPAWGTAGATRVTLREGPAADSAVVARLRLPAYDSAEILDWTRDRLKVKFAANTEVEGGTRQRDYVGWVSWGAVKPGSVALVLDSQSGETVARVPLPSNVSSATFSPDGRRVLFHDEGLNIAYEAGTNDYRPARTLEAAATGGMGKLFYGADGELRAPVWMISYDDSGTVEQRSLEILTVGGVGEQPHPRLESKPASKFLVAPEGSVVVIVRAESSPAAWGASEGDPSLRRAHVEVLDMETLQTRTTFALFGADAPDEGGELALSRDGSQLYVKASSEGSNVVVIDTRSGGRVREIGLGEGARWSTLPSSAPVGESFLMSVWGEDGEQGGVWVGGEKTTAAEKGIDYAVEAGGARYAVNSRGTELLRLDEKNRVRERIKIERPDLKPAPKANGDANAEADAETELTVYGLSASPDGKHLIVFVGTPECGC